MSLIKTHKKPIILCHHPQTISPWNILAVAFRKYFLLQQVTENGMYMSAPANELLTFWYWLQISFGSRARLKSHVSKAQKQPILCIAILSAFVGVFVSCIFSIFMQFGPFSWRVSSSMSSFSVSQFSGRGPIASL